MYIFFRFCIILYFDENGILHLAGDARFVLDPVQVAGDTGEGSWLLLLATGGRTEGGHTD